MDLLSDWIDWLPELAPGLVVSVQLTALCLLFGLPFGLALAVGVENPVRLARLPALVIVEAGRGAPALVLLYLLYFGLPESGITLTAFTTAVISLAWTTGAYSCDLFRAGLNAVPRGQREAAVSCGLGRWDSFRHIILPQAIRIAIPPLASFAVTMFQASSLAFVIAVPELMSKAGALGSETFRHLDVYALTALMYGAVTIVALHFVRLLERRLNKYV